MSKSTLPNIVIFMTDQQRSTHIFPEIPMDWIKENLPNYQYFLDQGVVFDNHICNSTPCGPSRASLFTGTYPANNGITGNDGDVSAKDMNFANVLVDAGYDVYYMGKLHMNADATNFSTAWVDDPVNAAKTALKENKTIQELYSLKKWTSPDFGTSLVQGNPSPNDIATLAGGAGHNDNRVVTGEYKLYPSQDTALSFLHDVQNNPPDKPFCLVVSLLNPHDISLYPEGWFQAGYQTALFTGATFDSISLPASYSDDLSTKPWVQAAYLNNACKGKLTATTTSEGSVDYPLNYLKFYAYLHTLSDALHGTILDAMGEDLRANTVMIRMADHGEMAMSHGGLQEKNFTAYNEVMRVPMMWVHPSFEKGHRKQMVSLIDLVPTLGGLVGADMSKFKMLQGIDYSATLTDKHAATQDSVLFNYNYSPPPPPPVPSPSVYNGSIAPSYQRNSSTSMPQGATPASLPNNIYALVQEKWKYAVYYELDAENRVIPATVQFELYDLEHDISEMRNLLPVNGTPSTEGIKMQKSLHEGLTGMIHAKGIPLPKGWDKIVLATK